MAIELPTNYQDDILSPAMNGSRRYQMINNPDGTVSFIDVTDYEKVGSEILAAQINAQNTAINQAFFSIDEINSNLNNYITFVSGSAVVSIHPSQVYDIKIYDYIVKPNGYEPICLANIDMWGMQNVVYEPLSIHNAAQSKIRLFNMGASVYNNTVEFTVCFHKV